MSLELFNQLEQKVTDTVDALEMMKLMPRFGAKRIVYVSCNPATLARDAGAVSYTHLTLPTSDLV